MEISEEELKRKIDIAWAAGLFEGEGCIFIQVKDPHRYKLVRLVLSSTDFDVLETFGLVAECGNIGKPYRPKGSTKPARIWSASGRPAVEFLEQMLPHLGARRSAKAMEALEAIKGNVTRYKPARGKGLLCSEDGCGKPTFGRGWCKNHYQRWHRRMTQKGIKLVDRRFHAYQSSPSDNPAAEEAAATK